MGNYSIEGFKGLLLCMFGDEKFIGTEKLQSAPKVNLFILMSRPISESSRYSYN